MFDPNGNSTDSDLLTEDDGSERNNDQPSNNKRKRKLATTEDHVSIEQHVNQNLWMREFGQMPPSAGMVAYSSSGASQGIATEDCPAPAGLYASGPLSPLFQPSSSSRNQEILSTMIRDSASVAPASMRAPTVPPLLGDAVGLGSPATFDQGNSRGPLSSVAASVGPANDPWQELVGTQSNSANEIDNATQRSTLFHQLRQRNESIFPSIPTVSNNQFQAQAPALFQLGSFPPDSNFDSEGALLRKLQLQQYQMEQEAALPKLKIGNNAAFPVPSNFMRANQAVTPSSLVGSSADAGTAPVTLSKNDLQSSIADPTAERKVTVGPSWASGHASSGDSYNCDVGRSKPLFLPCDDNNLSEYQCLLRKQIELFEATEEDIQSSTKGRNKPIFLGQVGVRCIHCRSIKPEHRARGATYYPATLGAMYQSGQTMAIRHLRHHCTRIPLGVRECLFVLKDAKSSAGGGKKYWSDAASVMGVYVSDEGGLRLHSPVAATAAAKTSNRSNNPTTNI
jgi:hypothetical protein